MAPIQKPPTDRFPHQRQLPVKYPPDPGSLNVTDGYLQMGPFLIKSVASGLPGGISIRWHDAVDGLILPQGPIHL